MKDKRRLFNFIKGLWGDLLLPEHLDLWPRHPNPAEKRFFTAVDCKGVIWECEVSLRLNPLNRFLPSERSVALAIDQTLRRLYRVKAKSRATGKTKEVDAWRGNGGFTLLKAKETNDTP